MIDENRLVSISAGSGIHGVDGGRNIATHCFGYQEHENFRNPELIVGGPVVQKLSDGFDAYWNDRWSFPVAAIMQQRIQRAENRGVQVRILTNSINSTNHLTAHSAYRKHIDGLVDMGVDIHEIREDAKDRDLYIESPVEDKSLCLHAKVMIFDHDTVLVGSANLDPRSLRIKTEMGLLIASPSLNQALRRDLRPDFSPRNAWHLRLNEAGWVTWVSDDEVPQHQPTSSFMRRIEDWFLTLLPIEDEM